MIAETHMPQGDMMIHDIIESMRHDTTAAAPGGEGGTGHRHLPLASRGLGSMTMYGASPLPGILPGDSVVG